MLWVLKADNPSIYWEHPPSSLGQLLDHKPSTWSACCLFIKPKHREHTGYSYQYQRELELQLLDPIQWLETSAVPRTDTLLGHSCIRHQPQLKYSCTWPKSFRQHCGPVRLVLLDALLSMYKTDHSETKRKAQVPEIKSASANSNKTIIPVSSPRM